MGIETQADAAILTPRQAYDGRNLTLSLNVNLRGPLTVGSLGNLEAQKRAFGIDVAEQIANQIIPQILAGLGIPDGKVPGTGARVEGSLSQTWEINRASAMGQLALYIRQQINGIFQLEGSRVMGMGQLVNAAKAGIAAQVAERAVYAVEQSLKS